MLFRVDRFFASHLITNNIYNVQLAEVIDMHAYADSHSLRGKRDAHLFAILVFILWIWNAERELSAAIGHRSLHEYVSVFSASIPVSEEPSHYFLIQQGLLLQHNNDGDKNITVNINANGFLPLKELIPLGCHIIQPVWRGSRMMAAPTNYLNATATV